MARTRVVVTGLGCLSPIGLSVEDSWRSILDGQSGIAPITQFDTTEFKTRFAAEVKGFDPEVAIGKRLARRMDRFTQLAVAATEQALQDSSSAAALVESVPYSANMATSSSGVRRGSARTWCR
jgi:3-oxoacyl-[acyl-carrier-protein] synthase II